MKSSGLLYCAIIGIAIAAMAAVVYLSPNPHGWESAVKPGDADTVLGNAPRTLTNPTTIEDNFLFKETVLHADGVTPRITKIVYSNRRNHLVSGNVPIIMYEHFRPDGTLVHDNMVFPEVGLGGGVDTKWRVRYFDADGKTQNEERYLREDNTIGVIFDMKKDVFTTYRRDGKTLRSVQERLPGNVYRTTYYRLDGKTVWSVDQHNGLCKVFFDRQGNPVDKQFSTKGLSGSFSMGPKSAPIPYREDTYTRPDRTVEYKQTWFAVYDDDYFQALSQVEVYAADGKTLTARIKLKMRHPRHGRFIQEVELFNADGTRLVRVYKSPGSRQSEETFAANGSSIAKKTFNSDSFSESFEDVIFQGFGGLHLFPEYDTDSHDI